MAPDRNLTLLLDSVNAGNPGAADALASAIHDDLRAMARKHLVKDFGQNLPGVTIQPTILADDTLMKLIRQRQRYDSAGHLFAIASRLMIRVLIDYHRERNAKKRGGQAGADGAAMARVSIDPDHVANTARDDHQHDADVDAFEAALASLTALDARKADVVRYRVLWGFTNPETAAALGVAVATVERDWAFAKAWLAKTLKS